MLQRLESISETGPPRNTDISHQITDDIFQIEKGRVRALYFYGQERRTLIFSHGFIKASQKTKKTDKDRAKECLKAYKKACEDGTLVIPED